MELGRCVRCTVSLSNVMHGRTERGLLPDPLKGRVSVNLDHVVGSRAGSHQDPH